jgi:3-deoxy-D-arabino-heptulosonate 7-phosphate (DAHP) synthase class II
MTQKEEFNKAIEILNTIEENINICCAVTMEPDEVLELVDKLRKFLNEQRDK